jgi:hypothetical protein
MQELGQEQGLASPSASSGRGYQQLRMPGTRGVGHLKPDTGPAGTQRSASARVNEGPRHVGPAVGVDASGAGAVRSSLKSWSLGDRGCG